MIKTSAVLLPVLYDPNDLPKGLDPNRQNELVATAFNTGWHVRFYNVFEHKNVVYERYIFEKEDK